MAKVLFAINEINSNEMDAKYRQMAFRSARWHCSGALFGNPWSNKLSGDRQRETTHEICCLAAK